MDETLHAQQEDEDGEHTRHVELERGVPFVGVLEFQIRVLEPKRQGGYLRVIVRYRLSEKQKV